MAASIDRLLQRLGCASDPGALVDEILDVIDTSPDPDVAGTALVVASPGALQQLAQLLYQQHAGAVHLAGGVLMETTLEDRRRLASSLAAAPQPVVEGLVGVLGSSTADAATKACAGVLLGVLVQPSQPCARQAARAGVFVHVAALLRLRPAGPEEAASSHPSCWHWSPGCAWCSLLAAPTARSWPCWRRCQHCWARATRRTCRSR
jgi:hypothetical protein